MPRGTIASCSLLALALFVGCSKTDAPSTNVSGSARVQATTAAAPVPVPPKPSAPVVIEDTSFRFPAAERIIAIGDIHGDVRAAREALRLGGAIDAAGKWVGGPLVVVQTGD